jgi:hypothetical protein
MIVFLLSSLAVAQQIPEPHSPAVAEATPQRRPEENSQKKKTNGANKQEASWKKRFYARPALSGSSFTSTDGTTTSALGIGGEGGVRYWEVGKPFPRLRGRTRGTGQYVVATNATGMEAKLGSFMGPWWKYLGLESGLDVSWDRYEWNGIQLDPTMGYGIPFIANTGIEFISVYAGFQPTFLSTAERRVDWSETDEFGFGHQFSTFAGVHLTIDDMSVGLGYTRTVTAFGVQQGYGLSLNLRG